MRQWYVLRSKPKQEKLASSVLAKASIETYVPYHAVHRQHGKPPVPEPFFPGYLFGRLDPDLSEVRLARYSPGVVDILGYGPEPWPVPDGVVDYIRRRLAQRHGRAGGEEFRPGERLIVASGPLRGLEVIFDRRLSATGRVRVLLQIVSRLCPAEVHVDQLRRVSKSSELGA